MKNTKCFRYIVAVFACASVAANAQPMVNYAEVPGRIFRGAALLDPFSVDPTQPNIFFGGPAGDNGGCSVKLIEPGVSVAACGDSDYGSVSQVGYDVSSGRLYGVGSLYTALATWQVRSSGDGGTTWALENTFSLGGNSAAKGIAFDGAGNVFVSGYATDSSGDSHWIVRKRNSSGAWTTIHDWSERRKSYVADKAHVANGYLFVTGEAAGKWAVQRLNLSNNTLDAPSIWAPKNKSAGAGAVTTWGSDLYVLGWAGGYAEASEQCVLQKSANNGSGPWQIVKTFAESTQINWPTDLAFDSRGNLYVIGQSTFYVANPANPRNGKYNTQWIVRTHAAQAPITDNWQSWSPLPLSYNQTSGARRVCPDNFGNVYVLGQVDTYSGSTFSSRNVLVQKWTMP